MTEPARRALIVIDVQNEYVTGNLLIEYPDIHTTLGNIAKQWMRQRPQACR